MSDEAPGAPENETPPAIIPVVAIAGRPNVGKSTLFNRLVGRRMALVADTPGVTRDRKEAPADLLGRPIRLLDTAGLEEAAPETLSGRMRQVSESAVAMAQLVVFVVDARAGITPADAHFAAWLRRQNKPVVLVANKAEGRAGEASALDAFRLGLGEPMPVSAEHGDGLYDLKTAILDALPFGGDLDLEDTDQPYKKIRGAKKKGTKPKASAPKEITLENAMFGEEIPEEPSDTHLGRPLKLAVVGRPNAGKSTLLNALLGEDRMLTGPEPGLTRDSIAVTLHDAVGEIELVDTAGLRRKARVEEHLEKMSTSASIEALKMAEVVVLAVDAVLGLHEQDLQIARLVEREGRACVLALTKWDAVEDKQATLAAVMGRLEISMTQSRGLQVVRLSSLTRNGLNRLLPAVRDAHAMWNKRVGTGALNRWFGDALERHAPPLVSGRRLKLRYITQAKARPPTFIVFGTRAEQLPEDYQRYLVNGLREEFDLKGTPIRLQMRGSENPFVDQAGR